MIFSLSPSNNTTRIDTAYRKKSWHRWLLRFLGPVLFILLIRHFDYRHALRMIVGLPPLSFLWALLLFLPLNLFKSVRWAVLMRRMGAEHSVGTLFNLNMSTFGFSLLSPGRMAEFFKALPLVSHDCPAAVAFGSAILDRLLDLMFVVVIGTGGVLFIAGIESALGIGITIVATAVCVSLVARFLQWILSVTSLARHMDHIKNAAAQIRQLPLRIWVLTLLLTGLLWLSYFASIRILASGLNIPLGLGSIFLLFSSIAVLNLLPVSVAGIGTRDALLLIYFSSRGWPSEQAAALAGAVLALLLSEAALSLSYLTGLTWLHPGKYGK